MLGGTSDLIFMLLALQYSIAIHLDNQPDQLSLAAALPSGDLMWQA